MFIKKVFLITFITTIFSSCCYANNESYNIKDADMYIILNMDYQKKELRLIPLDGINDDANNPQIKYSWVMVVNANKKLPYDTETFFLKGNCLERKMTLLSYAQYLKNKNIYNETCSHETYYPPHTLGDENLKILCNPNKEDLNKHAIPLPKDRSMFLTTCQGMIKYMVDDYNKNK